MKSSIASDSVAIAEPDVRAALTSIVESPAFRASPQLASFLRFVVEAALKGHSDRIKGYTIAVEALGRDEKFDPQTDPIVRVEAGRLRRALDRYYEGPGRSASIIIELPRGSYVPTVRRRSNAPAAPQPAHGMRSALARVNLRSVNILVPVVIAAGIVGHAGISWYSAGGRPAIPVSTAQGSAAPSPRALPKLHTGPSIAIEPISTAGELAAPTVTAASIETRLRDAFARYDDVTVMFSRPRGEDSDRATADRAQHTDYRLTGSLAYQADAAVSLTFQLIDTADASIVWTRSFDRLKIVSNPALTETAVVRDVATVLLQQFGVIYSRERKKYVSDPQRDPHFACLLDANEMIRAHDHTRFWPVRRCLEKAVAEDPTFASGYAALSQLYRREYMFELGSNAESPPLDRALEAARRALEVQPNNVRGHYALLDVHMARGEFAEAMAAGEKAIALNPYDATARFRYGAQLILFGETERGAKLVTEAGAALPSVPSRYYAALAIAAYLNGDAAGASARANQITNDRTQVGLLARILAAHLSGDRARAEHAVSRLVAIQPKWQSDTREQLKKYFHVPWVLERVAADIADAGLGGAARQAARAASGTPLPKIYVEPFTQLGSRPSGSFDPAWLRVQLVQSLARFDEVTIATDDSVTPLRNAPPTSADYRLAATVSYDGGGGMSLSFRFIEVAGGTELWTKTYDQLRPGQGPGQARSGTALPIIGEVSAALLHPFGVVAMQERVKPRADGEAADRYRCLLLSHDYLRSFAPAQRTRVRTCLEQAIAADPQFSPAFVALARIYLREYQFGSGEKDEAAPLARAQDMAERAIEINPASARAHFAMFDILAARGDAVGVRRFGEKAIALNPNDPPVVFHYGAQLIMLGDIDRGTELIRGIMSASTMPPARLDFALFVANYLQRKYDVAAHYAERAGNDNFTPGLFARALVAYRRDGVTAARKAIDRLVAAEPRWRDDPRGELKKFISSPAMVDQFLSELTFAGLVPGGQTLSDTRPGPAAVVR